MLPSLLVFIILSNVFPLFCQVLLAVLGKLEIIPLHLIIVFFRNVAREVDFDQIVLCLSAPCLCLDNASPSLGDQLLHVILDPLVAHLEILIAQDAIATLLQKIFLELNPILNWVSLLESKIMASVLNLRVNIVCEHAPKLFDRHFTETISGRFLVIRPDFRSGCSGSEIIFAPLDKLAQCTCILVWIRSLGIGFGADLAHYFFFPLYFGFTSNSLSMT